MKLDNLYIENTNKSPQVVFQTNGKFLISGRSVPVDAFDFYVPLLTWLDKYIKNPASKTEFHILPEYFNTTSSRYLMSILKKIEQVQEREKSCVIYWYEDEYDEENEYFSLIDEIRNALDISEFLEILPELDKLATKELFDKVMD